MTVELLTFQNVGPGVEASKAEIRPHEEEVDQFLIAHMNALLAAARDGKLPKAGFRDEVAEELFRDARDSSEEAFLNAATLMCQKLNKAMDRRTVPGLLVLFRTVSPNRYLTVVKLQVASEYAATLQRVGEGREDLRAIKDVLDSPGQIQKGLLYEDPRECSSVVAKEKRGNAATADYFLRAYDIVVNALPAEANIVLLKAISSVDQKVNPGLTNKVIAALPELVEGSPSDVLDQLGEVVPDTVKFRSEVEANLASYVRPIEVINPAIGVKGQVTVGSIKITGPVQDIAESVRWDRDSESEGWITTIRSAAEPVSDFRQR